VPPQPVQDFLPVHAQLYHEGQTESTGKLPFLSCITSRP
jgi:hypothetical protein